LHERVLAFDTFQRKIRAVDGKDRILRLALDYLRLLIPLETAGFFLCETDSPHFIRHTQLPDPEASRLEHLVSQAVEAGLFGWVIRNQRQAVFNSPDGVSFLLLKALRSRDRVHGMFAGICDRQVRIGRNIEFLMMNACLSCAVDVIEAGELRFRLEESNRNLDSLVRQRTTELEATSQRLEEAQELASLGSLDIDLVSQRTVWSKVLIKILQTEPVPSEAGLAGLASQFSPVEAAKLQRQIDTLIATGKPSEFEVLHQISGGTPRHLWARFHAAEIMAGKITRIFGTFQDITERRQTEEQLRNAKEAAETADRTKSAFLATISHELRTPLNAIMGYAQLLSMNPAVSEPQREQVGVIQSSSEHLLDLINDLLDISKAESSYLEMDPKTFDLIPFLNRIETFIRNRILDKNITFTRIIGLDVPLQIQADPLRLRQILLNLLSNAIRFTDQGGISLRISRIGNQIRYAVDDTGCGIEEEKLGNLFQPFHQVGELSKRRGGTGLGLAISRHILKAMGSDISVQSRLGQRSSFWFELKIASGAEGEVTKMVLASGIQPEDSCQNQRIPIPPPDCIGALYRLALAGKVMELKKELEKLRLAMPTLTPFTESLESLLAEYKMKSIRELLKSLLTP
jgi:signal transduction histidine kinase